MSIIYEPEITLYRECINVNICGILEARTNI